MIKLINQLFFIAMGVSFVTSSSHAAVSSYFEWPTMGEIIFPEKPKPRQSAFQTYASQSQVSNSMLHRALEDVEDRISPEFKVHPKMKPMVKFWLKIYTVYSSDQIVFFDADHPEVVYEAVNFHELAKRSRNQMAYEIMREREVKKIGQKYAAAFKELRKIGLSVKSSREAKLISQAWKKSGKTMVFADATENFKSQTGQKDFVLSGLDNADLYLSKMEEIFVSLKLPKELTRLSMVESSFNVEAYSKTGAAGVWQFMPNSGAKFLTIDSNRNVDERLSIIKSTIAAAKLLKENKMILKSWPFAISAYNSGMKGLMRFPKSERMGTKIFDVMTAKDKNHQKYLGWAGRNYYAEFLAMTYAEAYRHVFYGKLPSTNPLHMNLKELASSQSLTQFAKKSGFSLKLLKELNPDVRSATATLPRGFYLATPAKKENHTEFAQLVRGGRKMRSSRG